MNVRNCRLCGRIYNYVAGPNICPNCRDGMEAKFQEVKEYIREHKGCGIQEVADACNVETGQIRQWLRFLPEKERKDEIKKSCARVFQALRIDVNSEFEVLDAFLQKLPSVMAPGGRIAVLTFHSGEDRLVKKSFKELKKEGIYSDVATEVIRPSAPECAMNSRARSAKLRWAVRA